MESPKLHDILLDKDPTIAALDKFRSQIHNIEKHHLPNAEKHLSDLKKQSNQPKINEAIDEVLSAMARLDIQRNTKSHTKIQQYMQ